VVLSLHPGATPRISSATTRDRDAGHRPRPLSLEKLITHRYTLEETGAGLEALVNPPERFIKGIVNSLTIIAGCVASRLSGHPSRAKETFYAHDEYRAILCGDTGRVRRHPRFIVPAIFQQAMAAMEKTGIIRVTTHHEMAAAYMADGYARVGRKPGICMAQAVGAGNLAAGLRDAYQAGPR